MKKLVISIIAIALLSINFGATGAPFAEDPTSWCMGHEDLNDNKCEVGSQGTGSVCVQKNCGSFLNPCECFDTGWPSPSGGPS